MNIKTILPLPAILLCMVNNTFAMEVVKLSRFWKKVQSGEIARDNAELKLKVKTLKLNSYFQSNNLSPELYNKKIDKLFMQAAHVGIYPSPAIQRISK